MKEIPAYLLQPCDIILVSGTGFLSRGIKWFTNSKWSHVALYVGGGKQAIIEAAESGVQVANVQTMVKGHDRVCIRRYPKLTVEDAAIIKNMAYNLVYHPYDKMQLLSLGLYNLLRKVGLKASFMVSDNRDRIICSEVIAVAFKAAIIEFSSKEKMVTPDSLYDDSSLVTVYEASLK